MERVRHAATLARHGNFARAAIELNISQSTLSRSIQTLEHQLDLTLFERTGMGTIPTPIGKLFLRKAQDMLGAVDDLEDAMRLAWRHSGATVRLGMGPMPASLIQAELCRQQIKDGVVERLVCQVHTGMRLRELIEADELDVAVCAEGSFEVRGNLHAEHLFDIPISMRVREGHPLLDKAILTADDLSHYPFVGAVLDQRMIKELAPQSILYDPVIASDDFQMLAQLVASSDAFCIFPASMQTPGLVDLTAAQHLTTPKSAMMIMWAGESVPKIVHSLRYIVASMNLAEPV
ncbi:LysR family transcriptional regulator [Novosphingobium tardum]|uniref:LysR family transcriptional regulator n=1 Tax=Novosphingobium tardum TaxID=1538021 RepID=A0ABV8RR94_9SPHN